MFISIIYLNNDIWYPLRLAYMLFVCLFVSNPCIPTFPLGRHMVLRLPHCGLCFARPPGGTIWLGVHTYYVVYSSHNEFGCVCAYNYAHKAVCIQSDNWRNWIVPWPWISGAVNEIYPLFRWCHIDPISLASLKIAHLPPVFDNLLWKLTHQYHLWFTYLPVSPTTGSRTRA